MKLKKLIRDCFGFSKPEVNGVLVLIPLLVFFLVSPYLYRQFFGLEYNTRKEDKRLLDSLISKIDDGFLEPEKPASIPLELFNPNTYPVEKLSAIGIPQFLSLRIENYRTKGGSFRVKKDLLKIFDFPDSIYQQLEAYIQLPDALPRRAKSSTTSNALTNKSAVIPSNLNEVVQPIEKLEVFDLNKVDTVALKTIKGIGSSYAKRIVGYRRLLGGFHSIDQLNEVYGLDESLYEAIKTQFVVERNPRLKQITINLATFNEILAHPYIDYEQTKEILNLKSSSGKFMKIDDLYRLKLMDTILIKKLAPYIVF